MASVSAWAGVSGGVRGLASRRRAAGSVDGSVARVNPPATSRRTMPAEALGVVLAQRGPAPRRPRPPSTRAASASSGDRDRVVGEEQQRLDVAVDLPHAARSPALRVAQPGADRDLAERLGLRPRGLALLVQLQQGEQRGGDGHAVLAAHRLVEGEASRGAAACAGAPAARPRTRAGARRACGPRRSAAGGAAGRAGPRPGGRARRPARPGPARRGAAPWAAARCGSGSRPRRPGAARSSSAAWR